MKDLIDKIQESHDWNKTTSKKIESYNDFVDCFDQVVEGKKTMAFEGLVNGVDFMIEGNGEIDWENPKNKISYRITSQSTNKVLATITIQKS